MSYKVPLGADTSTRQFEGHLEKRGAPVNNKCAPACPPSHSPAACCSDRAQTGSFHRTIHWAAPQVALLSFLSLAEATYRSCSKLLVVQLVPGHVTRPAFASHPVRGRPGAYQRRSYRVPGQSTARGSDNTPGHCRRERPPPHPGHKAS